MLGLRNLPVMAVDTVYRSMVLRAAIAIVASGEI